MVDEGQVAVQQHAALDVAEQPAVAVARPGPQQTDGVLDRCGHFIAHRPGAVAFPLDVCDGGEVRAVADSILADGPLDLVVYCAGHFRAQSADDFDLDEMLRHQEVNYLGALHVAHAVMPSLLREGRGHLSLLGSVAGYRGLPRSLGYGPTKAALIHLAVLLGVGFATVEPKQISQTLEITLATFKSETKPQKADFLAQENQQGSGTLENKAIPKTTEIAPFQDNKVQKITPPPAGRCGSPAGCAAPPPPGGGRGRPSGAGA